MDRRSLSRLQSALNSTGNGGSPNTTLSDLPNTLLEAFVPGYSLISSIIFQASGFDVSHLVTFCLVAFGIFQFGSYAGKRFFSIFEKFCMSSIYIDDNDDLFESILNWIGEQHMAKVSRSVKAVTRQAHSKFDDDNDTKDADDEASVDPNLGVINFGRWAAKMPPRYEPYFGKHHFWQGRRLYFFDRSKEKTPSNPWSGKTSDEQLIQLTTFGRTTEPIRTLLVDIKLWALAKDKSLTNIRRPASKEYRRGGSWDKATARPSRPIDTVYLDPGQKNKVVADVAEYLHPSSPLWYATRGIPWRRGYLFHGPPGTGKSSLCFALAGLFGLDIYVVSLLEPTLTESDLMRLFNSLPRRCIVLLEDIDSAGLLRDESSEETQDPAKKDVPSSSKDNNINAAELAKALQSTAKRGRGIADDINKGISLSGLLNAIDGVASHEGRVLVMTTNHPEKLDAALIRPGRVDMQVKFTLATRDQTKDIFVRMYNDETVEGMEKKEGVLGLKTANTTPAKMANGTSNGHARDNGEGERLTDAQLEGLAHEFAQSLKEGVFSPAEVQNFLLARKRKPHVALREVAAWRDSLLEAKGKNQKVLDVQ